MPQLAIYMSKHQLRFGCEWNRAPVWYWRKGVWSPTFAEGVRPVREGGKSRGRGNRQRRRGEVFGSGRAPAAACSLPKGSRRQDGHARRVRHVELRRVHRAVERRVGQELRGTDRPGRRRRGHHDRGDGNRRRLAPAPAGLPRGARASVRLLHPRDDHGGLGPAAGESAPERRRDPRRARGQSLPVHRLREHRARRAARRTGRSERVTAETDTAAAPTAEFGRARLRKEDERLITGQTNWTDNIRLPGMLHVAFLRSPFAHARITSIDVSAARNEPGVIAAYSGADFADEQGSLPCAWPVTPDIVIPAHPPMATDEVRYVGEAVACVVARDRYAAADALAAIEVDYEQLPPVLDIRTALDESSPKVHEAGNKSFEWPFAQGDLEAAFRDAPVVIERTYRQQRLIPAAMEPRAVVCSAVGGEYTMWSATQIPHILRLMLALTTGIPEQSIRVIAPDVGGGFGSKLQVTAEEVLAVLIARKLGRPVKWTESRSEGNMTVHHGRDQWQRLRLAADSDGRIRGLDVDLLADMGAYLMLVTPGVPLLGAFMFNAIYKMDAYRFSCTGVFTTKTPTDAYRGAGRPEATYAIEHLLDDLAAELGVDPLELRERNWIRHGEFPYTTIAGLTYDSGNYEAATARAKELNGNSSCLIQF